MPDLVAGGNFGPYINASLIRRLANEAFRNAPKTFSANGAPSSSSPFHVTGFGHYAVEADDTFGSLGITWSGGGPNIEIVSPSQGRTRVNFGRGSAGQGDSFQRTLTARVTDTEGTRVTASRTVTILVNDSGGLPPVCQVKPWLPQCNPEG